MGGHLAPRDTPIAALPASTSGSIQPFGGAKRDHILSLLRTSRCICIRVRANAEVHAGDLGVPLPTTVPLPYSSCPGTQGSLLSLNTEKPAPLLPESVLCLCSVPLSPSRSLLEGHSEHPFQELSPRPSHSVLFLSPAQGLTHSAGSEMGFVWSSLLPSQKLHGTWGSEKRIPPGLSIWLD